MKAFLVAILSLTAAGFCADPPKGTLIFSDDFERTAVGEKWLAGVKSFSIVDGVLKAQQTRADHGAVASAKVPMRDGVAEFRFRLEGATSINAVWDDKAYTGSHAGHICRVAITPKQIRLGDDKEGVMRNDILEMRKDPARKAEAEKLLVGRGKAFPAKVEQGRWYRMRIEIAGDELRASLDDQLIGALKSPGIAHPTKTNFHFTVGGQDAFIDDVRVWATVN